MIATVLEGLSVCLAVFVFACMTPFAHVFVCVDVFAFVVQFLCVVVFVLLISVVLELLTELYQKA